MLFPQLVPCDDQAVSDTILASELLRSKSRFIPRLANNHIMMPTEQLAIAYKKDGFVSGVQIADEQEASYFRRSFDDLEVEVGKETAALGLYDWHFKRKFIWELATHPGILDCVEAFIGPNILLALSLFICKYGPSEGFYAWHQDITYTGIEPQEVVGVWYAIDDSDQDNGCVRSIPGSHLHGVLEHRNTHDPDNLALASREVLFNREEEEKKAVDLVLRSGEAFFQDGMTIHSSPPNRSTKRRCGLGLWFIPAYVNQVRTSKHQEKFRALLVRGIDTHQHFERIPTPFRTPAQTPSDG